MAIFDYGGDSPWNKFFQSIGVEQTPANQFNSSTGSALPTGSTASIPGVAPTPTQPQVAPRAPGMDPGTGAGGGSGFNIGINPPGPLNTTTPTTGAGIPTSYQDLINQFAASRNAALAQGAAAGQANFGAGSLGRINPAGPYSAQMQDVMQRQQNALQGFNNPELNALRSQGQQGIDQQQATEARQARAALGTSGIHGAQAMAQQNIGGQQAVQARANMERDLLGANVAQRTQALQNYGNNVAAQNQFQQTGNQYNLSQGEKEKAGQLATTMGYGGLAAGDTAAAGQTMIGQAMANAANQFGNGVGQSFVCTELFRRRLITAAQYRRMNELMFKSIRTRADGCLWYLKHGKALVDRAVAGNYDWDFGRELFVLDVLQCWDRYGIEAAQDRYARAVAMLYNTFQVPGISLSPELLRPGIMKSIKAYPELLLMGHPWKLAATVIRNRKRFFTLRGAV